MEIERTMEVEGRTWGRTVKGTWVVWDGASGRWEPEPLGPPSFVSASGGDPGGWAAVSRPPGDGDGGPPNPVDTWWNSTFPPLSLRRYLFALVAVPPITALVALLNHLRGRNWPFAVYVFSAVATACILGLAFLAPRRWASSSRPSAAPGHDPIPNAAGSGERPSGSIQPTPWQPASPVTSARPDWRKELATDVPIAIGGNLLLMAVMTGPGEIGWMELGVGSLSGLVVAFVFAMRRSVVSVVLVSLAVGFGPALLLQIFTSIWGSSHDLFGTWLLCSAVVFVFAFPIWMQLRDGTRRLPKGLPSFSIPAWLYLATSYVFAVGAAIVARLS